MALGALSDFNSANRDLKKFNLAGRCIYERNLIAKVKEAPKIFHSYIRWKKKGRPTLGPLKLPSGEIVKDPLQMKNIFAEAFVTVFVDVIPTNPPLSQPVSTRMEGCRFSLWLVRMALEALNLYISMGPDNIHPMLLKSCASSLAYLLYIIFHRSLHCGELPNDWKNSIVIPIFKSETRYNPLNHRPVSLTSVCCKTMERILADQITEYLETNSLLSNVQFRF